MQTTQLHNQLHKPDDTAHEETNYIKVQNIQIIPRMHMIVKIEEKNIDIRPLLLKKKWCKSARQTILRIHMIVKIKKDIKKLGRKNTVQNNLFR